jgi:Tol biopolymer transport system component
MSKLFRLAGAAALALVALPASAGALTIGTLPAVTTQVVNNGPGNQTDPHVSGDLVSYTSEVGGTTDTEIRHHNLATSTDAAIPGAPVGFGVFGDFLSEVSGSRIVFTRVTAEESAIFAYDVSAGGAPVELAPEESPSNRHDPAIGEQTVAWQDFTFTNSPVEPEVVARNLVTGVSTRLTNNALQERDIAVSPDGNVVVFTQCNTSGTSCDVSKSVQSGGSWSTSPVTSTEGEEGTADTDGALITYVSTRAGETDIYHQPVAGGAEQRLALAGVETEPNVDGGLISFDRAASPGAARDTYVYDTATDRLYRLTNTAADESLSDISISATGLIRVVYHLLEAGNFNIYGVSFPLPTTLAAQVQQPVNADGTSTFNANRGVVPLKFTLTENGSPTCELPPATLRLTRIGGVSPGPIDESLYTGSPDSGTQFRITDCHYHFNLSPGLLGPGGYLAEILINGAPVGEARFELK